MDRNEPSFGMAMDPVDTLHVCYFHSRTPPIAHKAIDDSVTCAFTISIPFLMKETRSAVVLTRIAKKLRKKTGDHRYRARVEDERASLKTLIWISCTRPLCECFSLLMPKIRLMCFMQIFCSPSLLSPASAYVHCPGICDSRRR